MKIPFLSRLLEIKEEQLFIEYRKTDLLMDIRHELKKLNRKKC